MCGSDGKECAYSMGDQGLIPELRRSPGEGNGNPFQHFLNGKSHGQRRLAGSVHGVTKSQTQLNEQTTTTRSVHDEHESEQALGVDDGQGSRECCSPWVAKSRT